MTNTTPTKPDKFMGIDATVWSNAEGILDDNIVGYLERGGCYAMHAAWEYCGYVWFDPSTGMWYEEIWVHGTSVATVSGDSPTNVIAQTLAGYGVR